MAIGERRDERDLNEVPVQQRATTKREERIALRAERHAAGELRGQRVRSATEKFLERTLVGIIYAGLIIVGLWFGPVSTAAVIALMSWLGASEFFRMMRSAGRMPNEVLGLAAAVAFPLTTLLERHWYLLVWFLLVCTVSWWYVSNPRSTIADVAVTLLGPTYVGLMLTSMVWLRQADDGFWLALGVVGSVWANDSCAYMVGMALGRHKMAPKISPKKSWEGAIGGFVGTMAVWVVMSFVWKGGAGMSIMQALVIGAVVCVMAVMGDLVESRIKRGVGVKDSGTLLPGHGGMLDRIDSLIYAGMTAYVALRIWGLL